MPVDVLFISARLLSWGATYLLHSTLLLAGVWLFVRLRPAIRPAIRETLWKTALVGGLITTPAQMLLNFPTATTGWTLNLPMWNLPEVRLDPHSQDQIPVPIDDGLLADRSSASEYGGLVLESDWASMASVLNLEIVRQQDAESHYGGLVLEPNSSPSASNFNIEFKREKSDPVETRFPYETSLFGLLAVVVGSFAVGLCRYLWQSFSLRRRLAEAHEIVSGPACALLDEMCRTIPGIPVVRLLAAPSCSEPAAFGLWRWTIVLPDRAERVLTSDELQALLAHELAHLVRGDNWWLFASRLICTCAGFQPLNHYARREWQRAAEFQCDAWAVRRTGNRLALARCLTEVAGWRLSQAECAASLGATGNRSVLADRIECLVDDRPIADPGSTSRTQRRLAGAAIVAIIGLIGSGLRVNLSLAAPVDSLEASGRNTTVRGIDADTKVSNTDRSKVLEGDPSVDRGAMASGVDIAPLDSTLIETRRLWQSLDDELRDLKHELSELQPLLKQPQVPEEARRFADRLQQESTRLEDRRAKLKQVLLQHLEAREAPGS